MFAGRVSDAVRGLPFDPSFVGPETLTVIVAAPDGNPDPRAPPPDAAIALWLTEAL